jgi:membrane protease YdiL (CAAX protease family)
MAIKNRRTLLSLVGLLLTLGFPTLPISEWENEFANVRHLVGYEIIWWALVGLVLLYVRLVERRPLTSIGFRVPGIRGVLIAIPAGVVMLTGLAAIYYVLFPALHLSEGQQMNQLIATPFWWRFISVIRAAVGEEVLFRGYAIERLQELTGSRTVAAVLSCAVFSLAHVGPWGWSHLLIAGFGGVMLTALYLWRRNLWVNIVAHFIVDGVAVLLA